MNIKPIADICLLVRQIFQKRQELFIIHEMNQLCTEI